MKFETDMISQTVNGVITQTMLSTTNSYDLLNRLTGVSAGSTTGKLSYNAGDDLTSRSVGGASVSSTYDAAHELLTQSSSNGSSLSFTYDTSGNRIQESITNGPAIANYSYDQANRLTQLSTNFFGYNGDGLRVSKTVGAGTPQHFTWELGDGTPVLIHDAAAVYVTGPGGRPIEQIMPNNAVFYLVADELGSTETITDGGGQPVTQYLYPDPYGAVTVSQSGTPQTPFLYAGQYRDSETGLEWTGSRYYDATSGNFLTPDSGTAVTRQRYTYSGDSPLNAGGLSGGLPTLSGTPEPTADLIHRVAATTVQGVGDFLGDTHDNLVSGDPLHVTFGVVNSFLIAASIMDAGAGIAAAGRGLAARALAEQATTRVFWAGSAAKQAATEFALANGGETITMTAGGQATELLTKGMDYLTGRPFWAAASRDFAANASGVVHVFQSAEGVRLDSIWATDEYKALMFNPRVTKVVYHIVFSS
jgi:RHS repeat-associated protein